MSDREDLELRSALESASARAVAPPDLEAAMASARAQHRQLRWRRALTVAAAAVALGGGSVALAATAGEDTRAASTPVAPGDPTGPVTTAGEATSPSTELEPTTVATTASTTTATPSTTTVPSSTTTTFVPPTGLIEELPVHGNGLGALTFGTPTVTVISHVSALVGPPAFDSGYRPGSYESFSGSIPAMGECTGPHAVQRAVAFGNLKLHFAGDSDAGAVLVGYHIIDASIALGPPFDANATWTLAGPGGLVPGANLEALALSVTPVDEQYATYDDGSGLLGITHSWNDLPGIIVGINAGDPCSGGVPDD